MKGTWGSIIRMILFFIKMRFPHCSSRFLSILKKFSFTLALFCTDNQLLKWQLFNKQKMSTSLILSHTYLIPDLKFPLIYHEYFTINVFTKYVYRDRNKLILWHVHIKKRFIKSFSSLNVILTYISFILYFMFLMPFFQSFMFQSFCSFSIHIICRHNGFFYCYYSKTERIKKKN
jgi:hypothetical protein